MLSLGAVSILYITRSLFHDPWYGIRKAKYGIKEDGLSLVSPFFLIFEDKQIFYARKEENGKPEKQKNGSIRSLISDLKYF